MSKQVESWFGIPLFTWESWDEVTEDCIVFYNVVWEFPSMMQYDGYNVTLWQSGDDHGRIEIVKIDEKVEIAFEGSLMDIKEFRQELQKLINRKEAEDK